MLESLVVAKVAQNSFSKPGWAKPSRCQLPHQLPHAWARAMPAGTDGAVVRSGLYSMQTVGQAQGPAISAGAAVVEVKLGSLDRR